ncbi:MAG: glycosyltransferase family 4 protein [Lachnospiraceae bacterium]|jgi:glycosyltransferase involved in cell wall biosynthesis|nr:glycosyltransferase family 4 protein [Lachnospiraceae bacterium]
MKILIIRTYPNKINVNSYNVQEIGLAKALNQKGHNCDIVLFNGNHPDHTELFKYGSEQTLKIYWLKGYSFLKNGFMPSVHNLIPCYDVIQVHEYDQLLSWQLYRKQLKPTVIYHGPYYSTFNRKYNLKCKMFDRFFLATGHPKDCIALAKSQLAEVFLRQKGFLNAKTVGVGLDIANWATLDTGDIIERRTQRMDSTIQLIYVGKIEARRNLSFLISVYRNLLIRYANLHLTIIGTGEPGYVQTFINSIKDLLDRGSITYTEKATQLELASIYSDADIFLFTSHYEIFGMVIAEAMYFGLPVVSSANGGASVLIENGISGWALPEFNEIDWVEKIGLLIDNKRLRQTMGHKASERINKDFIWSKLADNFINAYQLAIDHHK